MKTNFLIPLLIVVLLLATVLLFIFCNKEHALLSDSDSYTEKEEMDLDSITYQCGKKNLPIYHVAQQPGKIAISFDAAWGAEDFDQIMSILEKHKVHTTYFVTGDWVENFPEKIKILVEKGHDIGNHTLNHLDCTKLSKEKLESEIKSVADSVYELTGYEMNLFRAPYGAYNNAVIEQVYSLGYYPVQWDVDSLDWKDYGVAKIISTVCNHKALTDGSIILLHNGSTYTYQALDELLTKLEGKGYTIVPVSELIHKNNYIMDVTGSQIPIE